MTEQEKNEKLARFLGFKKHPLDGWVSPDGFQYSIPDFLHDLTTLFKWAVPELRRRGYDYALFGCYGGKHKAEIIKLMEDEWAELATYAIADEPAQALFEAIEKLIEMEEVL